MFSKLLASLILKSAVIMWERKNNQQQEVAVRETIKNIKNNANNLFARVENCVGPCYNKSVIKHKYIKAKIKNLKKLIQKSITYKANTYNIIRNKTTKLEVNMATVGTCSGAGSRLHTQRAKLEKLKN